jgi:hypothetical protein
VEAGLCKVVTKAAISVRTGIDERAIVERDSEQILVFADMVFVLMLKIHCRSDGSHLNAASGVVESGSSFASLNVPAVDMIT